MNNSFKMFVALGWAWCSSWGFCQTSLHEYPRSPVDLRDVRLTDSFWAKRLEINRRVTIPYAFKQCEITGRIDNFAIAGHVKQGEQCGIYPFDDSDVYKIIEGASYALATHPDPTLASYLEFVISLIAGAQEEDGYLFTARTNKAAYLTRWAGDERWSRLSGSHELYNLGHLFEAAAAHYRTTGKRSLLEIALKSAHLLLQEFTSTKRQIPPGHQEVEIGLVKLYHATGDERYLDLARFFLEQRGRPVNDRTLWGTYSQDHQPVVEQTEAEGHAVRLLYMLSGMTDIAALQADTAYDRAALTLWSNIISKKMYVTGGMGAQGMIEGFGANYDLPNMSAYCETCASIAFILFNQRLFLLHGESRFVDALERTLYNAFLSGVASSGDRFFYPNPLASRGQQRSPWFDCACCPSNITRFIPQIPSFVYATRDDDVFINLFTASEATFHTGKGTVRLRQETHYPWDGRVGIIIMSTPDSEFTLNIRIPGWSFNIAALGDLYSYSDTSRRQPALSLNRKTVPLNLRNGFATIRRQWRQGDIVRLTLPMPVRRVFAHDSVEADRGRVALMRGPLVYCTEWMDQPDSSVFDVVLPDSARLRTEQHTDTLEGIVVIRGTAQGSRVESGASATTTFPKELTAIPYFAWAARGPGDMAVWLARDVVHAQPIGSSPIAVSSAVSSSGGKNLTVIQDNAVPGEFSGEPSEYFCSEEADTVWVQYDFQRPEEVSGVEVYWVDDSARVSVPLSWRVLLRYDGKWHSAYAPRKIWGIDKNRGNRVLFEAFKTRALRLEAVTRMRKPIGIAEWKVF